MKINFLLCLISLFLLSSLASKCDACFKPINKDLVQHQHSNSFIEPDYIKCMECQKEICLRCYNHDAETVCPHKPKGFWKRFRYRMRQLSRKTGFKSFKQFMKKYFFRPTKKVAKVCGKVGLFCMELCVDICAQAGAELIGGALVEGLFCLFK